MNAQQIMQSYLDELVATGAERGVQLVAYHGGECVVDAHAGVVDLGGLAVRKDTLFPVFSVSKGVTATVIARLVGRGVLDYDATLAHYWPEFAAHGKGGITLRHVLTHTSGMAFIPPPLLNDDATDWDHVCAMLADATPFSPPGAKLDYHAVTYGHLLGEVARQATGRPFPQLLADEVCAPLDETDLFMSLPDSEFGRVAILGEAPYEGPPLPPGDPNAPTSIPPGMTPLVRWMNGAAARRSCLPASNGIATARALARHYAALCPGGVDGVELLSNPQVVTAIQRNRLSDSAGTLTHYGLGYAVGTTCAEMNYSPTAFGHGGYGGPYAFGDHAERLGVGFTRNYYSPRTSTVKMMQKLREAIGISERSPPQA